MSAGAHSHSVTVAPRFERSSTAESRELSQNARRWIRLATFAALALYGLVRWATLINPAPTARLLGLLALAVALAAAVPPLRRFGRAPPLAVAAALCLLALPVAGLRWHLFVHLRIAVSARHIGDGLAGLPNALVPYSGPSHAVRLVIALGAAVLLLDAAIVMAFAPKSFGDARRAGAALPLIALVVVPSTLVRPQLPYLQGLVLFALLAAFMWAERVRRDAAGTALVVATLAGVVAGVAAPRLDQHKPWIDYRAWAVTLAHVHVDSFDWNQTYGPLHWPRQGHVVMTVTARQGDYWKAEDLNVFNGRAWVAGFGSTPPKPDALSVARWSQTIRVHLRGMRTNAVIASGLVSQPVSVPGVATAPMGDGTWVADRPLGPGATYAVSTYSPHPSGAQLAHAGNSYPKHVLDAYRSIRLPQADIPPTESPQILFPRFQSATAIQAPDGGIDRGSPAQAVESSPYGPVYALARRLAAGAATPYAYALRIERFLTRGYAYNENPPVRAYPLVSFLFKDKIGYCQQFSGAMALLLRMGGVPARVAAGFTSGSHDSSTNEWVVTDIDAHAWVEAWFPHYGWVRFDPTPAIAPARGGQIAPAFDKKLPGGNGGAPGAVRREFQSTPRQTSAARGASAAGPSPLLIIPALVVLAAIGWLLRALLRSAQSAEDLLGELERALARTGRPLRRGVTLAALEHQFHDSPAAAGYIRSLRLVRYGGATERPSAAGRRALREQLRQGLGLAGRVRALWALPPHPAGIARRRPGP